MPDLEIKRKVRLSREDVGERLIALGTALKDGEKSQFDFDEQTIRFKVPDELEWEFELEVDGNETEVEIELKWTDAPAAEPPSESTHPRTNRRRGARAT